MYRIDRTDPNNIPITVDMSTTKNQAGLTWVGQFHSRYGEILHENTLKLLENFASNNPPEINDDAGLPFNKLNGMLWYDTNEDHTGFGNLKIQNGRLPAVNGGWKRLEIIISPTLPTTHTFGEVTYLTQTKTLAISRGNNWDDITVKKAIDSDLLDGLDSTQFLRRDVSDSLLATVHTSEVLPRANMTYNLGSPSYKYRTAYFGTLITEDTNSLIPTTNDTYVLGNSARQFKEINVILTKSQSYTDIYPLTHDANAIGTTDRRWNTIHVKTVNGGEFNNIFPMNTAVTLGKSDNRWNVGYLNVLDTVSTRSLIPEANNTQDLGSSTKRFRQINVETVNGVKFNNIVPMNNTVTVGKSDNRWSIGYFNLLDTVSTLSLIPADNNTQDLGSSTKRFRQINVKTVNGDEFNNILPMNTTVTLGKSDNRWSVGYLNVLDTVSTLSLIPSDNNTQDLGSSTKRFRQINVKTVNGDEFNNILPMNNTVTVGKSDNRWNVGYLNVLDTVSTRSLIPEANNTQDLGSSTKRFRQINVETVNGVKFNNIVPMNNTVTVGKSDNRWNIGYFNVLDTVSTLSLIPADNNTQDLGSSTKRFRQIDVNIIKSAYTENLTPLVTNSFDLGSSTHKYRRIYVDNLYGGLKYRDDINFDITMSNKSKGITWTGLTDIHQIYVEETIGSEQTNLVIHNQDNLNQDGFIVRQSSGAISRDVVEVKYSNIILRADNLKNIGTLEIENAGKGCRQRYNTSTGTLEFIFY